MIDLPALALTRGGTTAPPPEHGWCNPPAPQDDACGHVAPCPRCAPEMPQDDATAS